MCKMADMLMYTLCGFTVKNTMRAKAHNGAHTYISMCTFKMVDIYIYGNVYVYNVDMCVDLFG